jgi:PAS domain S-box-containing protein
MDYRAKLLLVEDDRDALEAYAQSFRTEGYRVLTANTGEEALELTREHLPDVVVLDARLPGASGADVCGRIKSSEELRGVLVLLFSTSEAPGEQAVGLDAGADAYAAHKPRPEELLARVEALVRLKAAEDALREQERQFRAVFENALEPIVIMDDERRYVDANPAACRLFGLTRDELLTRRVDDFVGPGFASVIDEEWEAFRERGFFLGEAQMVFPDGRERTVESMAKADFLPGHHVAFVRDITERKRAEEALRESQNLFESFMNNSPAIAFMKDEQGRYVYLNETFERTIGVDLADWRGKSDFELWPEETARQFVGNDKAALDSGSTLETIEIVPQEDGPHELLTFKFPITGMAGRRLLAGVAVDITARRRAEEQLVRIRQAVEGTSDAVAIADASGRATYLNRACVDLLGYTPDELNAAGGPPILYADDAARQEVYETILSGRSWSGEVELRRRDGRVVPVELKADAIKDEAGRLIGLVGICADVTARRKTARALEESREQLRQSQKMEAIGRLAGGVAHDFNNLLTVISGYSDFALQTLREDDPVYPLVEEVRRAADRAAALTRQLLAFGRKQLLQPKLVDLSATVSDLVRMLGRLIGEDVELVLRLDPALGRVLVDPGQVEQLVINLAVNARDAMPCGGRLTIETGNVDVDEARPDGIGDARTGPFVVLAFTDTGVGMSEEVKQRAFEPFFTTKGAGKGTGLGLSTVYGIVKQSGGFISVHTEEGRGSTFKAYFPRADSQADEPVAVADTAEIARGSETVLVVEDEPEVRKLTASVLERGGYTVLVAGNGGEALLLCETYEGPIHLMVTDVVMPRMGGRQLAERLAPLRPGMKVLYTSGYTDDAIVHHGMLEGEITLLAKPFTPDALLRRVREVLDGQ